MRKLRKCKPWVVGMASAVLLLGTAQAQVFESMDVGSPALAGSTAVEGETISVTGAGTDIWGTCDQFQFYYTSLAAGEDFDVAARVESLAGTHQWAKAEVMVRSAGAEMEAPDCGDPFYAMMATRADGDGQNNIAPQQRAARDAEAAWDGALAITPVPYPNVWLRVAKSGSVLSGYSSEDGVDWTLVQQIDTSTAAGWEDFNLAPTWLGLAVTSHDAASTATATFQNYADMTIDTDGDTMPDWYEIGHGLDPTVPNDGMDTDSDGLEDIAEYNGGTHPNKADTDDDGLGDAAETNTGMWAGLSDTGTDPVDPDTDGDGLLDGVESNTGTLVDDTNTGTDPLDADTDRDGVNDGDEIAAGTDPNRAPVPVGSGLIALYEFDGDLADRASSHDGIAHTDNETGELTFGEGMFGQAVVLDNALNEYVEAGGPESDFDRTGGDVSISMWFRVDAFDTSWQALIAKGEGTNYRLARRSDTDSIGYAGGVGEPAAAAPSVNDGAIHHVVALTRTGVQTELWIDGVLYETAANPYIADDWDTHLPLLIGANPDTDPLRYFNGMIDDVGIWARALDPAEIATIYNEGEGTPLADLLPPFTSIGLNFGADEADGTATGTLMPEDVAGVSGMAQPNWNNLELLEGSASDVTADDNGMAEPTAVSVAWTSANTWASTGRGEENNAFTGPDLNLMTGYLDTGNATTSTVTISGLPGSFAQGGYDLVVYGLGGVAGRGGGYRILDAASGMPLTDYIGAQSPEMPSEYAQVMADDPTGWGAGTYLVFEGLTAPDVTLEATTEAGQAFGGTPRAPVNAVQLVPAAMPPPTKANIAFVSFHPADDQPSEAAATAGFTEAPDVLYTTILENAGYNVDRVVTSATPDADLLNAYDLVIISRSVPSSNYQDAGATAWNSITAPTLILGGYPMRSSRMGQAIGTGLADTIDTVSLNIVDPGHPVFAGIPLDADSNMVSGYANIVTWNEQVQRGVSTTLDELSNGTVLATIATESDPAVNGVIVGEWQAGAVMANGTADVLAGHRLSLLTGSREASGLTSEGAGIFDLTGAGTQMYLNAVDYMLMPTDVTRPGDAITPSSDNSPAAELSPLAIDNDSATKYLNFDAGAADGNQPTGFVVTPSIGGTLVTGMTLTSANDAIERDPRIVDLDGSYMAVAPAWDDPMAWVPIARIDVPAFTARFETQSFFFDNALAYNHYRWVVLEVADPATANSMQIAEVELLGTIGTVVEPIVLDVPVIADGQVTITWSGGGELQTSPDLVTWTGTGDTSGTYTVPADQINQFYRVVSQ